MSNNNFTVLVAFRITKSEFESLKKKCPSKGQRSGVLRALVQMYNQGRIQNIIYKEHREERFI